jgi:beta-N-acetylglucosaminidase
MHRKRKAALTQHQAIALARRSPKFRTWYSAASVHIFAKDDSNNTGAESERNFTFSELAATWGLSVETIRRLFADEPGVLKMPTNSAPTGRRRYHTLRIPSTAAIRLHKRLSA